MENNLKNFVFSISNLINKYDGKSIIFEKLSEIIKSILDFTNNFNVYFLIHIDDYKNDVKKYNNFFKKFLIDCKNINLLALIPKQQENFTFENISKSTNKDIDITNKNTMVIFSDIKIGQIAIIEGYFSLFIESLENGENIKSYKEFENRINLIDDEFNIDSINYDYISFHETYDDD